MMTTEFIGCDVVPFTGLGPRECERCPNPTTHELVIAGRRKREYLCSECILKLVKSAEVTLSTKRGQA